MNFSAKIRPVNSLVFISDPSGGKPPIPVRDAQVLSTSSCISVACYPEQDGPTEIILGSEVEADTVGSPVFDGELQTPNRAVVISTVESKDVLKANVPGTRTRIRIWVNHPRWADKVIVGLG